jgi:hypothetical protein
MGSAVWLTCTGLDDLDVKIHSEVVVRLRQVDGAPHPNEAGGDYRAWLWHCEIQAARCR